MRQMSRSVVALVVALLLAAGFLAGGASQPQQAAAQTPIELQTLCVNSYTSIVSAPSPITSATCPTGTFALDIPDDFPFTLAINPYTGQVLYNPNPSPPYIPLVFPDSGTVPFCVSLYTGQLRYSASGTCSGSASIAVNVVGETEPDAVDDGPYITQVNVTLNEAAPGLLANDDLGLPDATVVSFGLTDATDTTADGVSPVAVAGGQLTVDSDGAFSLTTPTIPGDYSFLYRIENSAGFDDATVTIQVQQLPDAIDDSYTTPPNTTLTVTTADPDDLLDNDDLGFPEAEIASFGLADAGTTPADGLSQVALAGGQLSVDSDGSFELANPTQTGSFTFMYRLTNAAGSDDATVTIQIDTAPTVVSTTPIDTATQVAVDSNLTITFSEAVTPTGDWFTIVCVTSGTYTVSGSGGTAVTVTGGPTSYTLDPASDFASGELCSVTVLAAQISDDDSIDPPDMMESDYLFSFTTDEPPTVQSTSPLDNATDVAVDSDIMVTFSEPVTVTGSWFSLDCTLSGNGLAATVSGGPTIYTLDPASDLQLSEECTVTLVADQISDVDTGDPPDTLDGNENGVSEGSTTDDYSFSFTTPDAPPQVASTVPADSATSVAADADLTITFTEPVDVTGDWVTIVCGSETFTPSGTGGTSITVNASGDPLYSLDPDADLPGGETCSVTITADNVSDDDTVDPPDTLDGNANNVSEGSPTDDYSFSFGVAPVANDDSYAATGNVGLVVDAANGVILGAGADEGTGLSVSEVEGAGGNVGTPTATDQGGSVTLAADGSFTYDPPAGFTGNDTFSYRVSGASGTSNAATVTLAVADMVWFIDNSAGGTNQGTLTNPFVSINVFNLTATDSPGDTIFIHEGSGNYTTGIDLQDGQQLIGEAANDTIENIGSITLPSFSRSLPATGGNAPTLIASSDDAVDLATNNVIHGLDIGNTSGHGLFGAEVGTLVVRDVNISGTGGGVDLTSTTNAAIDVVLASLSSAGTGEEGVRLDGVGGSFSVTATTGTLASTNVPAVAINGLASPNQVNLGLTFASVTASNGQFGVAITNATGSFTVTGLVDIDNVTTTGVLLNGAPATFSFNGTTDVNGAGNHAIDLQNANGSVTFSSVTLTNFDDHGLRVLNATNAVAVNGGTITDTDATSSHAVQINGGAANVTVAASVTKNNSGEVVYVENRSGATVSFSNTLSCTGSCQGITIDSNTSGATTFSGSVTANTGTNTAVSLTSSGGHTTTFSGGLDIDTTAGGGINASTGGTLAVTGATNTIDSGSGTALNVDSTTIGASGLTFLRISANGALNGIRLNSTGTSGGLTVTGTAADNSGGLIQNSTGDALSFNSTMSVSLTQMRLLNSTDNNADVTSVNGLTFNSVTFDGSGNDGITGSGVTALVIQNSEVLNSGNAGNEHGIDLTDVFGASSVTGTLFQDSSTIHARIFNTSATAAAPAAPTDIVTFSGNTFTDGGTPTAFFGDNLSVEAGASGNMQLVVDTSVGNNSFTGGQDGVQATTGTGGTLDVQITHATVTGNTGVGINIGGFNVSTLTFSVSGVTTTTTGSIGINATSVGGAAISGTISNNVINGSTAGQGIQTIVEGNGSVVARIHMNNISNIDNGSGIRAQARAGNGTMDLTITNNTVDISGGAFPLEAINVESGSSAGGDTNTVCLNMANNSGVSNGGQEGYRLRQRAGTTFQLQDFIGNGANAGDVTTWINTTKSNTGTTQVIIDGTGFVNAPSPCQTP